MSLYEKLLLNLEHPTTSTLLLSAKEWNDLLLRIYENLVIKKEKREADFLLLNARQRYEKFLLDYEMIEDVVTNYHIASYLGITDVALSRIRKEMNLT